VYCVGLLHITRYRELPYCMLQCNVNIKHIVRVTMSIANLFSLIVFNCAVVAFLCFLIVFSLLLSFYDE